MNSWIPSNKTNVVLGAIGLAYLALSTVAPAESVTLTLNFDNYPEETSWEIRSGGAVIESGGTYPDETDGSSYYVDMDLPSGSYELVVYDSANDGMCCGYGEGR